MSRRTLWALGVVAFAMLMLALFDPWQRSPVPPSTRIVSAEALALVEQITVRHAGDVQQVQRQGGGPWTSVLPTPRAANAEAVAQLLGTLRLLRSVRRSAVKPEHGCGPQAPQLSLGLPSGSPLTFSVCAATADGRHRWLLDHQRNAVSLVENHLVSELLKSATSLRRLQLVPWVLDPRVPVRVSLADQWLEVGPREVRWGADGSVPRPMAIDPARRREWLSALGTLADEATPGCVPPGELLVEQGAQQVRFSAQSCVDAQAWLAVSTGLAHPERLADMHVLPTRRPAGNFAIKCKGAEREVDINEVDSPALWRWWEQLDGSAREIVPAQPFDSACSLVGPAWELSIGQDRERWIAWVPGATTMFVLDSQVGALLSGVSELFLSKLLIEQEAVFARRIEIVDASRVLALVRESGAESWSAESGAIAEAEATRLARPMAMALGTLVAERFAARGTRGQDRRPTRRIKVEFESELAGPSVHHELLLGGDAAGCWADVDTKPRAILAASDCAVLWAR